jgi:hypothetical protein
MLIETNLENKAILCSHLFVNCYIQVFIQMHNFQSETNRHITIVDCTSVVPSPLHNLYLHTTPYFSHDINGFFFSVEGNIGTNISLRFFILIIIKRIIILNCTLSH